VQRDILPIVEGTTVNTRYGMVRTDHILFIAAGAFHVSKPSDLDSRVAGAFPIRVELQSLTVDDFLRILTEPKASLTKQYSALLETEGVRLEFAPEALREMAEFAFKVNEQTENIGARRLHTIMERVLEDVSFLAPDVARRAPDEEAAAALSEAIKSESSTPLPYEERMTASGPEKVFLIDAEYVKQMVASIVKDQDLSRYILSKAAASTRPIRMRRSQRPRRWSCFTLLTLRRRRPRSWPRAAALLCPSSRFPADGASTSAMEWETCWASGRNKSVRIHGQLRNMWSPTLATEESRKDGAPKSAAEWAVCGRSGLPNSLAEAK
jgi:hypothetical protein